jgi:hypothetical protein
MHRVMDIEEVPDRDELHAAAVARVRRGRRVAIAVALLCVLAVPVGLLVSGDGRWSLGRSAVLFIFVFVFAVVLAALYPLSRRQDRKAPLAFGAGKATRRAVRRALRTGKAPDVRIDALARDTASKTLRSTWQLWLFVGVAGLQIIAAVLRAVGGASPQQVGLSVLIILCFAAGLAVIVVNRRRSRAYLQTARDAATAGDQR